MIQVPYGQFPKRAAPTMAWPQYSRVGGDLSDTGGAWHYKSPLTIIREDDEEVFELVQVIIASGILDN